VLQRSSPCTAGGAKFFKSIAQRELLSILSDDGLSLYSEMLIIKARAAHHALVSVMCCSVVPQRQPSSQH
jgi:hypothetical protein